jgi:hypothetical protein
MSAVGSPYSEPRYDPRYSGYYSYGSYYPYSSYHYSDYRRVDSHTLANRYSAVETLMTLCQEYVDADEAAVKGRQVNEIDGEALFDQIDLYRTGRLHSGDLAHWLRAHTAFSVTSEQLTIIHNFLDKDGHYYIGKDAFCMAVNPVHSETASEHLEEANNEE